jgi:hypothetical protein
LPLATGAPHLENDSAPTQSARSSYSFYLLLQQVLITHGLRKDCQRRASVSLNAFISLVPCCGSRYFPLGFCKLEPGLDVFATKTRRREVAQRLCDPLCLSGTPCQRILQRQQPQIKNPAGSGIFTNFIPTFLLHPGFHHRPLRFLKPLLPLLS